jgi:hypothetical protein
MLEMKRITTYYFFTKSTPTGEPPFVTPHPSLGCGVTNG